MPIYEYQCNHCDHQFDELQKIDAAELTDCPECQKSALVQLVSAPSFRLKGSGWYETDFKKDKRRNLADDGSKNGGKGEGTKAETSSSSETKKSSSSEKTSSEGKSSSKKSSKSSE